MARRKQQQSVSGDAPSVSQDRAELNTTLQSLPKLRQELLAWYQQHARRLPWRETGDPYQIWISEIMLQQTTVVTVVPYFERFIARFPNVQVLAAATQDEVLKYWEGLGYYSRARNIHKAAGEVVARHQGVFPSDVEQLESLPGIGRYTAGAIRSFAFDLPAPIVEANTLRLYARLMCYTDNPRSTAGQRALWAFAESLQAADDPGLFNQALMELGSQVCTPVDPNCDECPIRFACLAKAQGRQDNVPLLAARPEITHLVEYSIAIRKGDQYLLRKNPDGQRWAGLWDFVRLGSIDPNLPLPNSKKAAQGIAPRLAKVLESSVKDACGCEARMTRAVAEIKHSVTRYRIRLQCLIAEWDAGEATGTEVCWLPAAQFEDVPLSMTGRKFATLLQEIHQAAKGVERQSHLPLSFDADG